MRAPFVSRLTVWGALLVLAGCSKGTEPEASPPVPQKDDGGVIRTTLDGGGDSGARDGRGHSSADGAVGGVDAPALPPSR